jgi:CheY-like chemotaxis protein
VDKVTRLVTSVLVIDDHDVAREIMTRLLTSAGHRVHAQSTPIGATRTIVRENISVVVVDVEMPALRGDKLVALFRSNPRFAKLGLILVSSAPEIELVQLGRDVGADAVVPKIHLEANLVRTVERFLERSPN